MRIALGWGGAIVFVTMVGCSGEVLVEPPPVGRAANALHLDNWKPVGPDITYQGQAWDGRGSVQGRMNVVVANPNNPLDVWIGSGSGGVWRGDLTFAPLKHPSWTPITDDAPSLAVGAIAIDETTCDSVRCNTVWVGTGENGIRRDTQYGRGLLKVTWNGATQTYDVSPALGEQHFALGSITKIVLDPTTPDGPNKRLFVALSSGVSSNGPHGTVTTTPAGAYGIWMSADAGATWANVMSTGTPATDLDIDPLNGTAFTLYAGFRDAGVYRSTDEGATWVDLNGGNQLPTQVVNRAEWPELAVYPQAGGNTVVFAVLGDCWHPHQGGRYCRPGVWRSTDGGSTFDQVWSDMLEPPEEGNLIVEQYRPPISTYASYTHALRIHPSNPNKLWYGGIRLYHGEMVSQPGGDEIDWLYNPTLNNPSGALVGTQLHPDVHDIYVWEGNCAWTGCPSADVCAYVLTDGGFAAGDGLDCWNDNFQRGLAVTQFQSVSTDTEYVLGGTQDNGVNARLFGSSWYHWADSDASSTLIDRSSYPFVSGPRIWSVKVKLDGTPRHCHVLNPTPCAEHGNEIFATGIDVEDPLAWYPPMEQLIQPGFNDIFFATIRPWKWAAGMSAWDGLMGNTFVAEEVPVAPHPDINETLGTSAERNINVITAIGAPLADDDVMYVGYYDGTMFRTDDATSPSPSWTRVDESGLPERPITAIAVHPTLPLRAYVALSGFGMHSIYATNDGGSSWSTFDDNTDPNNELATRPVNALVFVPTGPPVMFAGTDEGVYRTPSADIGSESWTKSTSLPHVAVYDLAVDGLQNVYAGTHGRGVWRLWASEFDASAFGFKMSLGTGTSFSAPFSGNGFDASQSCELTLVDDSGAECVTSETDADGATLSTNEWGTLVASKGATYSDRPMGWACYDGTCAGGVPAVECPLAQIKFTCGSRTGSWTAPPVVEITDPASTQLSFAPAFLGGQTNGSFSLRPSMQRGDGTTEELCSVAVPFSSSDTVRQVLDRAAAGVNADNACIQADVRATVVGSDAAPFEEDGTPLPHRLHLSAPARSGLQLVTAIDGSLHAVLGIESVGLPVGMPVAPRLDLSGEAAGGTLTVTELTAIGSCQVSVQTERFETAETITARLRDAFDSGAATAWCIGSLNARDAVLGSDGALRFVATNALAVHNTDSGLSYTIDGAP